MINFLHKINISPQEEQVLLNLETNKMHKIVVDDSKETVKGKLLTEDMS